MAADYRLENLLWSIGTVLFIIVTSVGLGYLARLIARWRGLSETEQRKVFWGFMFAGPWIVGFVIFVLGPALASLYYSFTDYKLGESMHWTGLDNYRQLLLGEGAHGRRFSQALFNSFYYALIGVPLQIGAALLMALLLNHEIRGIRLFRAIFYLPVILAGGPAILLAWRYMLSANGGFINIALRSLAQTFFVFDWLYRGFIYVVEGFNGFYAGLTRGDPIGPLWYTLPALLGVLALLLLLGDWTEGKRVRAWRAAQIIGLIVLASLLPRGLVAEAVDPAWTYVAGTAALVGVVVSAAQGRTHVQRLLQWGGLALFGVGFTLTLVQAGFNPATGSAVHYLIACVVAAAPLALSLVGRWNRRKLILLGSAAAVLALIVLVRLVPGQLDGGRLNLLARYLTFGSALEHPEDQVYLEEVFPAETMSSLWIYGLVVIVLVGAALLNHHYPRARRTLIYGALILFALLAVGSFLDGRAYFQAFADVAAASGEPTYHFARFREATAVFPDQSRVPLWMTNELWTKPSLVLITMWSSGAGMLIFLAALKGVPLSLYEAAEVDGAGRWKKFTQITMPMISPALFYNIVIGLIGALQTFESIYILSTAQNQDTLASAAFFLFVRTFRQLAIGQGAAAAWILVVVIVILTALQFRYSSWVHYEA